MPNTIIEQKQLTISITEETFQTLQYDMLFFQTEMFPLNINKLANLIVLNYSGNSQADFYFSMSQNEEFNVAMEICRENYVSHINDTLRKLLPDTSKNLRDDIKSQFDWLSADNLKKTIEAEYAKGFYKEKNAPIHGAQIRFTLGKKSVAKLLQLNGIPSEKLVVSFEQTDILEKYRYKSVTKYLGRLFEAYAALPIDKREEIIFSDYYKMIYDAIEHQKCLSVTVNEKDRLIIKPYKVLFDIYTGYNYLIGYAATARENSRYVVSTFRIYRFNNLQQNDRKGTLSEYEISLLNKRLEKVTPAYIYSEAKEIHVLINKRGQGKFNVLLRNRPKPQSIKEDKDGWTEYIFYCTEFQAQNYFFQFGADAIVTSPESLSRKLSKLFFDANQAYEQEH